MHSLILAIIPVVSLGILKTYSTIVGTKITASAAINLLAMLFKDFSKALLSVLVIALNNSIELITIKIKGTNIFEKFINIFNIFKIVNDCFEQLNKFIFITTKV